MDPLPDEPLGTRYPDRFVNYSPADSADRRTAAGDGSQWYTERSPWGGPVVPTFLLLLEAARVRALRERLVVPSSAPA